MEGSGDIHLDLDEVEGQEKKVSISIYCDKIITLIPEEQSED